MILNQDLQIRDPYVVPMQSDELYYLFGSTDKNIWGKGTGFDVYVGKDLQQWEGPFSVFRPSSTFFSDENFWAPEVYEYAGRFYMFATFKQKDNGIRGTAVLVSNRITGPFTPHSDGPVTPPNWHCLDGTLHVDSEGNPWMVFCHEWVQIEDGEICAQRLSIDLKCAVGEPVTLFKASEAPWTTPKEVRQKHDNDVYVTDGPFVYQSETGTLFLIWASFTDNQYALGVAKSMRGDVIGPWEHLDEPLYKTDGGHGMLFSTFDGRLMMALHSPNQTPMERPRFLEVVESEGWINTLAMD